MYATRRYVSVWVIRKEKRKKKRKKGEIYKLHFKTIEVRNIIQNNMRFSSTMNGRFSSVTLTAGTKFKFLWNEKSIFKNLFRF